MALNKKNKYKRQKIYNNFYSTCGGNMGFLKSIDSLSSLYTYNDKFLSNSKLKRKDLRFLIRDYKKKAFNFKNNLYYSCFTKRGKITESKKNKVFYKLKNNFYSYNKLEFSLAKIFRHGVVKKKKTQQVILKEENKISSKQKRKKLKWVYNLYNFATPIEVLGNFFWRKKKKIFFSIYHKRKLKVWKLRKFYGNLTDYELKTICSKVLKKRGDVLLQFLIQLESRLDTMLYRTGWVVSFFEAKQLILHNKVSINSKIVNKRSFILKNEDILSVPFKFYNLFFPKIYKRLMNNEVILYSPSYLEICHKSLSVTFVRELLNKNNVPFPFNFSGSDLNHVLYYHY